MFICTSPGTHEHLAISSRVDSSFKRSSLNPISLLASFSFFIHCCLLPEKCDLRLGFQYPLFAPEKLLNSKGWPLMYGIVWCRGGLLSSYFIRQPSDSAAPIKEGKIPYLPGREGLHEERSRAVPTYRVPATAGRVIVNTSRRETKP